MGRVYEAASNGDQVLQFEEENISQEEMPNDEANLFALTHGHAREPTSETGLKHNRLRALGERGNFNVAEFTSPQQALFRARRTIPLDPERLDPHLITLQELPSPEADQQYRRLAVSLITAAARRPFKRLLLTSAQHGEGRTTVMLNLAGALARAKLRVLVVDTDFARPSVLRLLGLDSKAGLAEVFTGNGRLGDAAITLQPLNITVLVTREAIDSPAEILASVEFQELLNLLENDFDFILFDSPPLLDAADANLLARLVDTTLLVIRPDATNISQMERAVALLDREDISGVVINRAIKK